MKQAQVLFINPADMVRVYGRRANDDLPQLAKQMQADGCYSAGPVVSVDVQEAEDAAEELFDLSNNPTRTTERNVKYGWGYRSVSVGDIVVVDGTKFFCAPVGWVAC